MERGTQLSFLQLFPAGKGGCLHWEVLGKFPVPEILEEKEAFDISFGSVMDKNLSLWQAHETDNYSFHLSPGLP